jgi:hypothetical protein
MTEDKIKEWIKDIEDYTDPISIEVKKTLEVILID